MHQFIGVKAIIENNGEILLIRRSEKYRKDNIDGIWDIPGGRINFGEEPIEGLKRELLEETGLEINEVKRILDASTVFKDDETHIVRITYLCTVKNQRLKLSGEHTESLWVEPKKINFQLKDKLIEKCINLIATRQR